jgi:phosphohistidine phosphatase
MKTLLVLRHAKSSWDDLGLPDFDRPLARRGERDAPRMGKALARRGPLPEVILSSPAVRARQTVEAFAEAAGLEVEPKFDRSLYGAAADALLEAIRRLPQAKSCALLVGHNPGLEDLLSQLTGKREEMPTAALACLDFDVPAWKDADQGGGKLRWSLSPKQL